MLKWPDVAYTELFTSYNEMALPTVRMSYFHDEGGFVPVFMGL